MLRLIILLLVFITTKSFAQIEDSVVISFHDDHKLPSYVGGKDSLLGYIESNLIYPLSAINDNIEGTVYIKFFIDTSGHIQNVVLIEGVRDDLDNEALRIVKKMPKWIGGSLTVPYILPIEFSLKNEK